MKISTATAFGCRRLASAFGATLIMFASSAAWAQLGGGPVGGNGRMGRGAATAPQKPPEPAPEAIPGSKPKETAAPPTRPTGDMQPTDALFDAINRGDIAAARDALNRGADMQGVNILGMTPMELSVDLGRNDISFLLLSMLGEDSDRGSRALGRNLPPSESAGKTARADKPGAQFKAVSRKPVSGKAVSGKPVAGGAGRATQAGNTLIPARPLATPKLFANDGGTPLPSAGFLGFDSRSASN